MDSVAVDRIILLTLPREKQQHLMQMVSLQFCKEGDILVFYHCKSRRTPKKMRNKILSKQTLLLSKMNPKSIVLRRLLSMIIVFRQKVCVFLTVKKYTP
jgi:hypothetical protein